jgi:hypothetical protein
VNLIDLLHEAEKRESMSNEDIVRLIAQLEGARNRQHATDLTVEVNILNLYAVLRKREPPCEVKP